MLTFKSKRTFATCRFDGRQKRDRSRGQAAICLSLIMSLVVFSLGLLSFEITQYMLAGHQLKANVQIAALACETALAESGGPGNTTNQSNAMTTALNLFQLNSILGHPLINATLVSGDQMGTMAAGQAALSFQFLDPITHAVVTNPTSTTGTIIQATGIYGYTPSFTKLFGVIFIPIQIATSAVSGVQELDLVVALDISGGMDDETPVTLVQRYWDYDNNYPPHHIVYMVPPSDGNPGAPAQGPIGSILCNQAPRVNVLPPQNLQNGTDPLQTLCQQYFSEGNATGSVPAGSNTVQLRQAGNTDSSNPPGDYTLGYTGMNGAPGLPGTGGGGGGGTQLSSDLQSLAQVAEALIRAVGTGMYSTGPQEADITTNYSVLPELENTSNLETAFGAWIVAVTQLDHATIGQVVEAVNAGQVAANTWGTLYAFSAITVTPHSSYIQNDWSYAPQPQPLLSQQSSFLGPTPGYSRYGYWFGSGSAPSDPNEVIVPLGTAGPNNGPSLFQPTVNWGPTAGSNTNSTFTDAVVNLDGNNTFGSFTYQGLTFPSLGALVEAARGNLESYAATQGAGLDLNALGVQIEAPIIVVAHPLPIGAPIIAGGGNGGGQGVSYLSAYQQAAALQLQPLMSVENTLPGFLQEAIQMGNTDLGLTAFNDAAGTSSAGTFSASNISPVYAVGGTGTFPLPGIVLGASNASTIDTTLTTLRVGGNRNVAAAIQAALAQLASSGRTGAQKAIVLITDGPPTVDLNDDPNSTQTQSYADARAQAVKAYNAGVPIYCLSIYADPTTQSNETTIYNDTNNDPAAGGIAAISGHGAKCYQVSYSTPAATQTTLTQVFGNMVRQLGSIMAPGTAVAAAP